MTQEALTATALDIVYQREKVLEAHRILMSMNEANRDAFHNLVETLEAEAPGLSGQRHASL